MHMRISKVMTKILVDIDETNRCFIDKDGTMVVRLDKALHGCVEASNLLYKDLRTKLESDDFHPNPYDPCVFNKVSARGDQLTVVVHVDDLFVTCVNEPDIETFCKYLKRMYPEIKEARGAIVDYIGMTTTGDVKVTMSNCLNDILTECGVTTTRATPAIR